jgi:predicted RNA-binding protein with PUA-like domain
MAYWLIKSEPDVWSFEQQTKKGAKGEAWTGVRNFTARRHLQEMKKGDRAFFYHTGDEKRIMGIAEVIGEYRKDPSDKTGTFGLVDVRAVEPLARPVTLAEIRADKRLKDMVLVKVSRLSVQPITAAEWKTVNDLAKRKVG